MNTTSTPPWTPYGRGATKPPASTWPASAPSRRPAPTRRPAGWASPATCSVSSRPATPGRYSTSLLRQQPPGDAGPLLDKAALALAAPPDGLSRRDLLAGAAMGGLLASEDLGAVDPETIAHDSVRLAEALLRRLDA